MESVKPVLFQSADEKNLEAVRTEPDPQGGWRGADLAEDELADDDYANQFPIAQAKE